MYAEELRRQMIDKDKRNQDEARKNQEWDNYYERKIASDIASERGRTPKKGFSKGSPVDPNGPPPSYENLYDSPYYPPKQPPPPPLPWQRDDRRENDSDEERASKRTKHPTETYDPDAPASVPAKVNAMVKQHMEGVKERLAFNSERIGKEMERIREEVANSDKERTLALQELRDLKLKLKDQQLEEDMRHNYMYHILFKNWKAREKGISNGDLNRKPYQHIFPDLEKVDFRLPENFKVDEILGDNTGRLNFVTSNY